MPELQKPAKEWNEWRVLAVGDKVTFWCNGKMAWEGTDLQAKRGYIGLQAEGAPIEFRNLRIKELGYEPLNDLKQWTAAEGWKQEGDALASDGKTPLASTKKDYKDYVLRLEWKGDKDAVGAIQLRGDKTLLKLGDATEGTGGVSGMKPTKKLDNPAGQWNYLEAKVAGGKATVWLNGTVVVDGAKVEGDAGAIALAPKGPMQFRNIRVKEMKN